ncbi:heavy-metal-associated domain-containing protein [Bdellovibrio sp. HCB337]|uniref:heavy-metal-associated domain-containing protein n=1 Tax=Bdellovibrio sp. HCB337 TaxID=3394358 RepID=UPI0039A64942
MKWLIPALLILPISSFAETTTYDVTGMTCNSCVKAIKAQVCKMDGIEKCEVSLGKIMLSTKEGITLNEQSVKEAVGRAGDYKVSGSSTKK